ncbi:hypothetical protein [Brevibacillus borstelensis]|uniref:hypothetical protein n=1 Tax=Brevibacillus borstelensis TaxID=45462 RepID=UPI0030C0D82D
MKKIAKFLMTAGLVFSMLSPTFAASEKTPMTSKDYDKIYGPESGSHKFLPIKESQRMLDEQLQQQSGGIGLLFYGRIVYEADYIVKNHYQIPKVINVTSSTLNSIRILSDAQPNTGTNKTYDVAIETWRDFVNDYITIDKVEMRVGSKQYEYFYDLDDGVDYYLRILGNVKGHMTVYRET